MEWYQPKSLSVSPPPAWPLPAAMPPARAGRGARLAIASRRLGVAGRLS